MKSGFKISYSILKDKYNGLGCFSNENIKSGTLVWKFNDANVSLWGLEYCKRILKTCDEDTIINILNTNYCITYNDTIYMVDLRLDDGRYVNHSSDPNILSGHEINQRLGIDKYTGNECFNSYAIKDIPIGSEICDDYNTYSETPLFIQCIEKKLNINNSYLN